ILSHTHCHSERREESRSGMAESRRTHAKRRHVCATPDPRHPRHTKTSQKTLTPNDQSARLLVSMGEGRLTLAVASLKSHEYSHGDSHSPASRYSRASTPTQVHCEPQGPGRRPRQPRQSQRHFEGSALPAHAH